MADHAPERPTPTLVQAGEIRLAVAEQGAGAALLLVAGGFMDMDQWEAQVAAFGGDYRVIRFDPRGVGQSDKPAGGYTVDQLTADTAALIEALGVGPCVVFGTSLGGVVALELALTRPELVRGLIVAATPAGAKGEPTPPETQMAMFRGAALPMEQAAAALQDLLFASGYHDDHPELLEAAIAKRRDYPAPPLALMGPLQSVLAYDPLDRLGELSCPTLILHGEDDLIVPVGNATILGEHIAGARVVTVPHAGHALVIEAAEAVNEAVGEFLAALQPAS